MSILDARDCGQCYLLTCTVWQFILGQALAMSYIRLMFGVHHVPGHPPRYCAFNIEPRGLPVRMVQGSLYIMDYRLHHWLFYLATLPVCMGLQVYSGVGFAVCMIVHGLWYEDRFEFKYSVARHDQLAISKNESKFQLDYDSDASDEPKTDQGTGPDADALEASLSYAEKEPDDANEEKSSML